MKISISLTCNCGAEYVYHSDHPVLEHPFPAIAILTFTKEHAIHEPKKPRINGKLHIVHHDPVMKGEH